MTGGRLALCVLFAAPSILVSCSRTDMTEEPRTVLLVVLDTVRSQSTSICGYERPTTPVLELFVEGEASLSCGAVAPSSWTLPSHASFFTGLEQPEHRVGAGPGTVEFTRGTANGLDEGIPTLAERFAERGYRGVLVSGNPFVSELAGLTRGFDIVRVAENFASFFDEAFVEELRGVLASLERDEPLFLFLNVSDAHNPWNAAQGVDWLPPRPGASGIRQRRMYESGELSREDSEELLAHVRDVYDYGIFRADRTLGRVLRLLHDEGWLEESYRIVVTSDHGEFLGGHGRLLHGGPELYEAVVRVPLIYKDSRTPLELPPRLSATSVFELTLNGRLPSPALPVRATTFSNQHLGEAGDDVPCWKTTSALWTDDGKLICDGGGRARFRRERRSR